MTANPDAKMPSGVLGVVWRDVATSLRHQGLPVTWGRLFACLAWSRGVQAVEIYRLSHYFRRRGIPVLPELLMRLNQLIFTADIYPEAEIGSGFMLIHPCNVVIGKGAVIGDDVQIFNGVSLGNRLTETAERPDGYPTIGDEVILCTGAKIIGPVSIGARSMIGANAVVTFDVPPNSRVVGGRATIL